MTSMNISMPESMKDYVEERVQKKGYGTASEYVRDLIRADQRREAEERLHGLLLEGLNSPRSEMTDSDWEDIRREVQERLAKRSKS